jgi:hypothetical protein
MIMKRKSMLHLLAILMVAVLSVGLASCGGDDEDTPKITSPIVGTWNLNSGVSSIEGTLVLTGQGNITMRTKIDSKIKTSKGTYEVSSGNDGIAKIYWEDETIPEIWEFTVSTDGNTLEITSMGASSSLTWHKQK